MLPEVIWSIFEVFPFFFVQMWRMDYEERFNGRLKHQKGVIVPGQVQFNYEWRYKNK